MAASFTPHYTVFGDYRVFYSDVTISGVDSAAFLTGLNNIYGGSVTPVSVTSAVPGFIAHFNKGSGATAIPGSVWIQTCTAGDVFSVFCFGK